MIALALIAAAAHLTAAHAAAERYGQDPELVLAIAWKETRHQAHLVSPTNDCGPMQVHAVDAEGELDVDYCDRLADVAYGYREGARMLRAWIDAKGNLVDGLGSYACGWRISRRCRVWAMLVTSQWVQYEVMRGAVGA